MQCKSYGTECGEQDNFCGHCGVKLREVCDCWVKKSRIIADRRNAPVTDSLHGKQGAKNNIPHNKKPPTGGKQRGEKDMECKNDADAFTKKVNEIMALLDALKENRENTDAYEEIHKQLDEYQSFLDENYLFIEGKYSSHPCLRVDYHSAFFAGLQRKRREKTTRTKKRI